MLAKLINNGVDVLYLADINCADLALDVRFKSPRNRNSELVRLTEALNTSGMRGSPILGISGTFIGVVRRAPKGSFPLLILVVERVESLSIVPVRE